MALNAWLTDKTRQRARDWIFKEMRRTVLTGTSTDIQLSSQTESLSSRFRSADHRDKLRRFVARFSTNLCPGCDPATADEVVLANLRGSRFDLYRAALTARRRLAPLWNHLPLVDLDRLVTGGTVDYYQDWISHAASDDPFWDPMNFRRGLSASTAEFHLMGGWYDPYLPDIVADYGELRRLGRRPRLVIGPWNHYQMGLNGAVYRETVALMERTLADGGASDKRPSVRVQLTGTNKWLDFDDWPPPSDAVTWRLQSNRGLSTSMAEASEADRYRFDPADPTPSVGGPVLLPGAAGPKDNRALEARKDVLVYTSDPLPQDLDVVGPMAAELYVHSSLSHTDFFVRLCDVDDQGRSFNVSDGIARLGPEPASLDVRQIRIEMSPAAHRFGRGHRLRVQVSSGAHPRFATTTWTDAPIKRSADGPAGETTSLAINAPMPWKTNDRNCKR